jgi:hypothetical protein
MEKTDAKSLSNSAEIIQSKKSSDSVSDKSHVNQKLDFCDQDEIMNDSDYGSSGSDSMTSSFNTESEYG